jgi:outer membrane protein assembly factor BamB
VISSPAYANGVVYVGSYDNNVYALNARTGAKLWNYTTGALVYSGPAVANGVVYVGGYDHNIYALGNRTTSLTASVSRIRTPANKPFSVNGTLSGANGGISGATITLQRSTNGIMWTNVATATTTAAGTYQFSTSVHIAHTYYYRTYYPGSKQYNAAHSPVLKVVVS